MEISAISSRDALRTYWQQVIDRPVWNAAEVEAIRQSLLPVATMLQLTDWQCYLTARKDYGIDCEQSATRLSEYLDWVRQHRECVEDWLVAHGLFSLGAMQGELQRAERALTIYDELIDNFKNHPDKKISVIVSNALNNASYDASQLGRSELVFRYMGELRRLASSVDDSRVRYQLAKSLLNLGNDAGDVGDLIAMNRYLDELRQLAVIYNDFGVRKWLAKALFNYSIDLEKFKDKSLAYDACVESEELLKQFSDDDSKLLREKVAIRKNRLRNELGMPEEDLQDPPKGGDLSGHPCSVSGSPVGFQSAGSGSETGKGPKKQVQTSDGLARADDSSA